MTQVFIMLAGSSMQVYRARNARNPKKSPPWQCADHHYDEFEAVYPEAYQPRYGSLRPIIPEVVHKFIDRGNLERGFARIRYDHCEHEFLLAFSCKSRRFRPSRHRKSVQTTARFIMDQVVAPVPHCHYVLAIPNMLRPHFQRHRPLLKHLCTLAHESLTEYRRTALDCPNGVPGVIMTLHTFGEYLDFHPYIHALVADALFLHSPPEPQPAAPGGTASGNADDRFHTLPEVPLKPVEELFRAKVINLLVQEKLLPPERLQVLQPWKHSGFNVHAGERVATEARADLEALAQYLLRNLKMAILHRKNSLSYKTLNGARIGDIHMSLIHTCELNRVNPFDNFMALEQHADAVAKAPTGWFLWNYRQAIEAVNGG